MSRFIRKVYSLLNYDPVEVIYWTRLFLAIIAALLCAVFKLAALGFVFGIIIYFLSYVMFRYCFKTEANKIDGTRKLYTIGLGSYVLTWITIWSLLHTYLL